MTGIPSTKYPELAGEILANQLAGALGARDIHLEVAVDPSAELGDFEEARKIAKGSLGVILGELWRADPTVALSVVVREGEEGRLLRVVTAGLPEYSKLGHKVI